MAKTISIEMLHEDMESLKRDVAALKALFLEPKLKKEIIEKVIEARQRMKTTYVTNDEMKKEFGV